LQLNVGIIGTLQTDVTEKSRMLFCRIFVLSVLLGISLVSLADDQAVNVRDEIYIINIASQFDSQKIYRKWRPIFPELEKWAGLRFVPGYSPGIKAFENNLMTGYLDFICLNPYHIIRSIQSIGYKPLVHDKGRSLNNIIVVPTNSLARSIHGMDESVLTFPFPGALVATLLVRSELPDKFNIKLVPKYVQIHGSVYLNVALNEVEAGLGQSG